MPRLTPTLQAMRAFDAAARNLSYQDAADELGITQAALSYQIRKLEERLEVKLFRRVGRSLELTSAGELMGPKVRRGFELLEEGVKNMSAENGADMLTVIAEPSITSHWIAPRLHGYFNSSPQASIRFMNRGMETEPAEGKFFVHIGQRDENDSEDQIFSVQLFEEYMVPVVAPALLEAAGRDGLLDKVALIHDTTERLLDGLGWDDWFASRDENPAGNGKEIQVANAYQAIQIAVGACGVPLARLSIAMPDLLAGRVVAPFDMVLKCVRRENVFSCSQTQLRDRKVSEFLEWLQDEAKRYGAEVRDFLSDKDVIKP